MIRRQGRGGGRSGGISRRERADRRMKKLFLLALVAVGGFLVYRQLQADKAEQDLWTEATDPVPAATSN